MSDLRLYEPHANQIKIHESKAKHRVVVAGRRFGKSALALNEGIARAMQLRDQIVWIVLPLYRQAKEVYWIDPDITKYFMPLVMAGICKADKQELSLHFTQTNSWIRLKGSDNYTSLRGSGIDLLIWDEVADVKIDAFSTIEPSLADSPNHRVLYIGTPKGLNHFHDFALQGDHSGIISTFEKPIKLRKDWQTWHFTSYDNLTWSEGSRERKAFVDFINEKKAEAEEKGKLAFFNQEYLASFEESAGRFFPKWTYATHVVKPFMPKLEYERDGSIDWGRAAPMAWFAHVVIPQDYEGLEFNRVFTFKEVYGTQKSPYEQAEIIVDEVDYTTIKRTYYDPSMSVPQSDGSMSVAEQFKKAFNQLTGQMPIMIAASNKRVSRWAAMDNWMRIAPDGLPYWMITENCKNLIRTIPEMMPDSNDIEDLDTMLEDHAIDSAGYFLQYIPWIDAGKMGGVHPRRITRDVKLIKSPLMSIDLTEFERDKQKIKDWRSI